MSQWRVPYAKFGDGPGLERVAAVARRLGVDLPAFGRAGAVIVGSNGKGSTAAMCASLLGCVARPVGLFTSPHLMDLNERFKIDGEDIPDDDLNAHWRRVTVAIEAEGLAERIGAFEFLFLIAADWFAARACVHTVWEAGIGGRFDPVRLIEAQRVALTSLDLEHTELLGDTLEDIARDKLDAAPEGALVLVGESCRPQRIAIEAHAAQRQLRLRFAGSAKAPAALRGAFQQHNAAIAIGLARDLAPLSDAEIDAGLAEALWPGRLEVLQHDPLVVIDVGHTPRAVEAALAGFEEMRGQRAAVLVCGASADKNVAAMIGALAPRFDRIVCTAAHHKGEDAARIALAAQDANPEAEIVVAESVTDARRLALTKAGAGGAVYVAGGLFLAAEFRAVHLGRDPASVAFF